MRASSAGGRTTAVGCAAVLLLAAGCAGSSESATTPAPTPTGAAPSSTLPPEEAALRAYTEMWETVVAASHEGETDPAELERHATGGALVLMREALQGAAEAEVSGEPVLSPEAVVAEPGRAEITDCLDDSTWTIGTGSAAGGAGQRRVDADVTHDGLVWRVSELRIWEPGTC
ncbi:hypothetical protein [Marinitenerispora sediminis]|uniref:Secreted protein/lipoprotein n=1 Tax=Marinitenerispora sediminis TaxID=1931232 RepID=A0A368T391_9ACTN|nr:hypothetical protein [Marinitenerispora sediminis]RCV49279.1 hypothetical protein DEF28_21290 [Marinitenerispora sediminis]RCV56189.1 hypothetical protein DEF24_16990 [Marinitenerispora sediminis]RCV57478.1 hypothetical protein DEF23_10500 [Marinitenerispora sediminis]